MITIVNYGLGNLGSIENMLRKIGAKTVVCSRPDELMKAKKIILPGVGSFDRGMSQLKKLGLMDALNQKVIVEKVPVLGICLGMQLMTNSSEEGVLEGLGWINATTTKFQFSSVDFKVPHMGWNDVCVKRSNSCLFSDMYPEPRFYFVHSYYVECEDESDVLTETVYGAAFASGIEHGNIYGVQFHPEKSHKYGMKLLENYWKIPC